MVETELTEDGASQHCKNVYKAKSRSSRREGSSVMKETRGERESVKRKKRAHCHTPDDNSLIDHAFIILERNSQDLRSKSTVCEKKKRKSDNTETPARSKDKKMREKSVDTTDQKMKSSRSRRKSRHVAESTDKLSTKDRATKNENTKEGVKFDENVKYDDELNTTAKSKTSVRPRSESSKLKHSDKRKDTDKEKVKNRKNKSIMNELSEKSKGEFTQRQKESTECLKITINTKERVQTDSTEVGTTKIVDDIDKSQRKKEKHQEVRGKRKSRKSTDVIDSITLICSPERKSKRSSRQSCNISEASRRKHQSEKEFKQVDPKSPSRERKNKIKCSNERIESHHQPSGRSGKSRSSAYDQSIDRKDRDPSRELSKRRRSDKSKRQHSERSSSRSIRQKRHRDKSKGNLPSENQTDGNAKKNKPLKHNVDSSDQVDTNIAKNNLENRKKSKKQARSKFEDSEIFNREKSEDGCTPQDHKETDYEEVKSQTPTKSSIRGLKKVNSEEDQPKTRPEHPTMIVRKDETVPNIVKNDILIKVSNKENILLKGVQDLTVKELYLMENLKDYELKLNEQFLKKMKRKKREFKSMNDGISMQPQPPVTNIPVCRLPSVKEIFKISNLADYEKKYKEMQDKKRIKNLESNIYSAMGRKKLTKFSLASKEDSQTVLDPINKAAGRSSQWMLLNNLRGAVNKNEGGDEVVCNMGLTYEDENNKDPKGKYLEKGDAKSPCQIREIARGLRTTSKTKLSVQENDGISDFETGSTYLKMCEKFRRDIREESKKLLQNLAENKNWRISIKDSSLQSIKKKPSMTSNDEISSISNFDCGHVKKNQIDSNNKSRRGKNSTLEAKSKHSHMIKENSEMNTDFPWLPSTNERNAYEENGPITQTFDKNPNKNMGAFINKFSPPEDLFGAHFSERSNLQAKHSRKSDHLNASSAVSNSSFTLSMFEKDKDLSDINNTSVTNSTGLIMLKTSEISREIPEMNILHRHEETESIDESLTPWIHRSGTLERIINEIEDSPEKDTNASPKILRDCRFDNKANKTFSEVEKSKNVLLSYISQINYSSKTQNRRKGVMTKSEKKNHVIFDDFSAQSINENKIGSNDKKYHDSLICLRDLSSFNDESLKPQDLIQDEASVICSRSCISINTLGRHNNKKPCKNYLKASLQSANTTFKCDLKAEERSNGINTKLIISDPNKKNNILQIQFCGKLNINFNKDNIELGNVDSNENQKSVDAQCIDEGRNTDSNKKEMVQEKLRRDLETSELINKKSLDTMKINTFSCGENTKSEKDIIQEPLNNLSKISNFGSEIIKNVIRTNPETIQTQEKLQCQVENEDFSYNNEESINLDKPVKIVDKNNRNDSFCSDELSTMPSFVQEASSSKTMILSDSKISSIKNSENVYDNNSTIGRRTDDNKENIDLSFSEVELDAFFKASQTESTLHQEKNDSNEKRSISDDKKIDFENNEDLHAGNQILKKDIGLIEDASAQTDFVYTDEKHSNLHYKDACTSSTFESKDKINFTSEVTFISSSGKEIEPGNKSYSSSTNSTGNDTLKISSDNTCNDVTSSSIDGIDIVLNNKAEPSLLVKKRPENFGNDKSPNNKTKEIKVGLQFKPSESNPNCEIVSSNKTDFASDQTFNDGEKETGLCDNSHHDNHISYKVKKSMQDETRNKAIDEKKKLLLSHSEEEAFKYLLLKGIGKTSVQEKNPSHETPYDINSMYTNPKLMFSTIKNRLEYYKSKAESSKLITERSCGNLVSSKIRKAPLYRPISQENKCFSCLGCPCNQHNQSSKVWESHMHSLDKSRKELRSESTRNVLMMSDRSKPCLENPDFSRSFDPNNHRLCYFEESPSSIQQSRKAAPGYFGYDEYSEIGHQSQYHVDNDNYNKNTAQKAWDSRCTRKEPSLYCHPMMNENDFRMSHLERTHSQDRAWSEYNRKTSLMNSSASAMNQRSAAEASPPHNHSHRPTTCYSYQSQRANYKHVEQTTASVPTRHQHHLISDIFHDKEGNKRRSPKMSQGEVKQSNQEEAERINKAPLQEGHDPGEYSQGNEPDKKKFSRKRKFSKHASKIWKSIFKKSKKFDDEILEYQHIPPERFLEQRPKLQENKIKIKKWLKKISQSKATDFQNVQEKLFKKLNKIMTSEVTMPLQEVFDIIQKPQFHKDNHSYSGRKRFERVHTTNYLSDDGHYIMITEQLNVRGFLVSIGLKDDVAWEAQNNPELNSRLQSAIAEARSWVNKITMSQGLLIYILAVMTPSEVHNYYLQIVEAIINSRISNVGTLLSVMMVLKRYERGKYGIKAVVSKDHVRDLVPKQISDTEKRHQENRARFIFLYNIAKRAAAKINTKVDKESAGLLARLTASYSPGLKPYLNLLAHYIAQRVIFDKGQLTMAVSFLQSLSTRYFDQAKFELSCGLAQNKVVLKGATVDLSMLKEVEKMAKTKVEEHQRAMQERLKADWVKRKKVRPLKESQEKIPSDKSNLERKPSTMDLLKDQNKTV